MISPKFFIDTLGSYGIDFFAGVPDSLLKNICAYIADHMDAKHNVIAANEGAAVGLAAGYHLATGKIGVVYMQNSGEGNIINPLASLTDKEVYNIPALLLIGWRGRPGVHDEPQHVKQGKVTTGILNTMGVNYDVLCKDEDKAAKQIAKAVKTMKETGEVYALVIEKDTFEDYKLQSVEVNDLTMSREEAIQTVAATLGTKDVIVSTTGMISRELFEYRAQKGEGHERDFLTVGSMGHASQIALGIALEKEDRKVWCFDGKPYSIWVCYGRSANEVFVNLYDLDWNVHPEVSVFTEHYKDGKGKVPKPECLDSMLAAASKLSEGFPEVRVDFYVNGGKLYFGELTFASLYGKMDFFTDEYLVELGKQCILPVDKV